MCNQASAVNPAVTAWVAALKRLDRPFELLALDAGSTDETPTKLAALVDKHAQLRILPTPPGIGAALRVGLATAQHPFIGYSDLESAYQPNDVVQLVARLEEPPPAEAEPPFDRPLDLVNGCRTSMPFPPLFRVGSWLQRWFWQVVVGIPTVAPLGWQGWSAWRYRQMVNWCFGVAVRDVDSGMKVFRRTLLARCPIQSAGPFVHAELLAKVNFQNGLLDELPLTERAGPFTPVPWGGPQPSRWTEGRRVFQKPDFGPPLVEGSQPASSPPVTAN
jgi:glycosyltransferase involved in cell wall biosynthesis